jgi:hypothetical protein
MHRRRRCVLDEDAIVGPCEAGGYAKDITGLVLQFNL